MLHYVFQTKNEFTVALSGPGSAAMEAAVADLTLPEDRVLVFVCGKFVCLSFAHFPSPAAAASHALTCATTLPCYSAADGMLRTCACRVFRRSHV